ncbi:MAG: EF-P lysine aminoacylase GenX [Gammaproteobacteria bacterium]|jgi:elongation factor P--(R)-beta-lysine ligase|nr:EF-P lysine aminoacylase GenX [Gammaproteobacteria bacterium]MBT7308522.1 EF-P lysine aminoacylase GenX [Gammaproteobacteria bacterium]
MDSSLLQERATFIRAIRSFFFEQDVIEVETPVLSSAATTDPQIDSFVTTSRGRDAEGPERLYLQCSPELFMKRLLAEGSGPIFQLGPSFRAGEISPLHNPEFMMLEWYRPGYTMEQLMDEVEALVSNFVDLPSIERITVAEAFEVVGVADLYSTTIEQLQSAALAMALPSAEEMDLDWDGWVDYLMVLAIIPRFSHAAIFFTHYPASQAALARISPDNPKVAERFELILNGMEIANGFCELTDGAEQRNRFQQELSERSAAGLEAVPMDEKFLQALDHGLPDCSGVALGVERLMMLSMGKEQISEVMPFSINQV